MSKYDEKISLKLDLIKYLHNPHTTVECSDELGIHERTVRKYLDEGDIKIDNVQIPVNRKKMKHHYEMYSDADGVEEYGNNKECLKSSVHPIVLPLNLTEVYMLTNGLLDILGTSHPLYKQYKEISNKIYSQLSDYAKTKIIASKHGLTTQSVKFRSENEMIEKDYNTVLMKASKQSREVRVITISDEILEGNILFYKDHVYLVKDNKKHNLMDIGIKNIELI